MKRLSILSLAVMVSLSLHALNEENTVAEEHGPAEFQPKPLDDGWSKWLMGKWEGLADSDVGTARVWMEMETGLNGQFLIMKSESTITDISDKQKQYYKDTLQASALALPHYREKTVLSVRKPEPVR